MFLREKEFEEGFVLESASLGDAKEEEKIVCRLFKEGARYLPLHCQMTQSAFCHVVLPRDTVFIKKCEETVSITLKAFLVFDRGIGCVGSIHNMLLVETLDRRVESMKMSAFQTICSYGHKDRHEQIGHLEDKRLEFRVKGVAPQIVVKITDEMDQAFLLAARGGIITGIEIRDEDTRIVFQ